MSYSKNSNDSMDTGLIEHSNEYFRVVYSHDKLLDTRDNNTLRVSLVNKKQIDTSYALYLKEVNNKDISGVYYTINGEEYVLTDNVIYLGSLSSYGTDGDAYIFDVSLRGFEDYSFYYSIGEVSYGS
jgi:hypothetical protein